MPCIAVETLVFETDFASPKKVSSALHNDTGNFLSVRPPVNMSPQQAFLPLWNTERPCQPGHSSGPWVELAAGALFSARHSRHLHVHYTPDSVCGLEAPPSFWFHSRPVLWLCEQNRNYTAVSNSLSAAGFSNLPELSVKTLVSDPP